MNRKYQILIVCVALLFAATTVVKAAADAGITVKQTADKITVTGGKSKKIASDKFALSKDGWYIIKVSYTGADVSTCQLSLVTQKMITEKETIGGLLTNWIGPNTTEKIRHKGTVKSEDYMIYVDDAEGPWTIEILKNPKPSPVSTSTTFSGTTNKVTPFFHLKKGSVKFTMHQKLKGQFSSRLEINLINADTGAYVTNLCHNATQPTQTATADIPAAGNYILEVIGGDSWDVSYAQ
jgi:hypothetical protein